MTTPPPSQVTVVISPPSIDLDVYKSFDEDFFLRTLDDILPESSSFDDYNKCEGSSSVGDTPQNSAQKAAGGTKPRYFALETPTKRKDRTRTRRQITKMSSGDEESSRPGAEPGDSAPAITDRERVEGRPFVDQGVRNGGEDITKVAMDTYNDETTVMEEDVIFAGVQKEKRQNLMHFIVSHPFMAYEGGRVKRSERRRFIEDIRKEAITAGMDETGSDQLVKYMRRLFLEINGDASTAPITEPDGSVFGDMEEDDEQDGLYQETRKTQKRKGEADAGNGKVKKAAKRMKKTSKSSTSISEQDDSGREVVDRKISQGNGLLENAVHAAEDVGQRTNLDDSVHDRQDRVNMEDIHANHVEASEQVRHSRSPERLVAPPSQEQSDPQKKRDDHKDSGFEAAHKTTSSKRTSVDGLNLASASLKEVAADESLIPDSEKPTHPRLHESLVNETDAAQLNGTSSPSNCGQNALSSKAVLSRRRDVEDDALATKILQTKEKNRRKREKRKQKKQAQHRASLSKDAASSAANERPAANPQEADQNAKGDENVNEDQAPTILSNAAVLRDDEAFLLLNCHWDSDF